MQFMSQPDLKQRFLISIFVCLLVLSSPLRAFADTAITLTPQAQEAAKLLGLESQVNRFIDLKNSGKINALDGDSLKLQLTIIRKVMTAGLELRTTSAKLDKEIAFEQQALDKLTRQRDFAVAATNNINFLQLGILSTIIDGPLGQSHNPTNNRDSNRLNIVSGLMVGGFALLALTEQHGGFRRSGTAPNMLGQPLGLEPPAEEKFPPMLWSYLNSVNPDYTSTNLLTRRQQLIEYWKNAKVLPINIKKQSTIEQVSVLGPRHRWWSETIKLINSRITMLFDLRGIIDLLNTGLADLLQALD